VAYLILNQGTRKKADDGDIQFCTIKRCVALAKAGMVAAAMEDTEVVRRRVNPRRPKQSMMPPGASDIIMTVTVTMTL
jgi:hypothetical protein